MPASHTADILELFDPAAYTSVPTLTMTGGVSLAHALLSAAPEDLPPPIRKALRPIHDLAERISAELTRREGHVHESEARQIDLEADRAWSAFRDRLQAWTLLPPARFVEAAEASAILHQLFGSDGLAFLTRDYVTQASTMEAILNHIEEVGLDKAVRRLAGTGFVDFLYETHARFVAMVRERESRRESSGENLHHLARQLHDAIVRYATKVCATVDEDDAESVSRARHLLQPIDVHRATRGKSSMPPNHGEHTPH